MEEIKDARMELRLTRRMKGQIERTASEIGVTPSELMRILFQNVLERRNAKKRSLGMRPL